MCRRRGRSVVAAIFGGVGGGSVGRTRARVLASSTAAAAATAEAAGMVGVNSACVVPHTRLDGRPAADGRRVAGKAARRRAAGCRIAARARRSRGSRRLRVRQVPAFVAQRVAQRHRLRCAKGPADAPIRVLRHSSG